MRDAIKEVLAEWLEKLDNDADLDLSDLSEDEYDLILYRARHLMGVALFLKEVADKADDMDLLGHATRAQRIAKVIIDEELRGFEEHQQQEQEGWAKETSVHEAVDRACRAVFVAIGNAGIDMSAYRKAIEDSRPYFNNRDDYLSLLAYTDERKVFKNVCREVRDAVRRHAEKNDSEIASHEWIQCEFEKVLSEAYRKADKHVAWMLKRHAAISPVRPPSSSDTAVLLLPSIGADLANRSRLDPAEPGTVRATPARLWLWEGEKWPKTARSRAQGERGRGGQRWNYKISALG